MLINKKADINKLAKDLNISTIISKILINKDLSNLDDANKFLDANLKDLRNPRDLKDLNKGVSLIKSGILSNKKILIAGDYDVDGITSTAILYTGLKKCGANVSYRIPDRITEGYGINESIIREAHTNNVDIIITCDNGIAAYDQVKLAKELGMQVIITDHHDVPFKNLEDGTKEYLLPPADAVINPKQNDCNYPFDKICGATVAFKFIQVLYEEFDINEEYPLDLIQYAAIGTVCDVVDLVDENRIIVKEGLRQINNTSNLGLKELIDIKIKDNNVSVYALGFLIGPCLNASGRLELASLGVELLLTENEQKAKELAEKLSLLNIERQSLTQEGLEAGINEVISNNMLDTDKVLVVYLPDLHESIAGIVAGRLKEKFNLPTIVLTKAHDGAKGSARSIEGYNIFEELVKCKELLGKFGGHPMAAGLSLPTENINEFRTMINHNCTLTEDDLINKVSIDMALPICYLSTELIDDLKILEPFGKGNSKPAFGVRGLSVIKASILGKNKNVLKLQLREDTKALYTVLEGIYFGDIENFKDMVIEKYGIYEYNKMIAGTRNDVKVDLVYYPEINEFNGKQTLQLKISNIRLS